MMQRKKKTPHRRNICLKFVFVNQARSELILNKSQESKRKSRDKKSTSQKRNSQRIAPSCQPVERITRIRQIGVPLRRGLYRYIQREYPSRSDVELKEGDYFFIKWHEQAYTFHNIFLLNQQIMRETFVFLNRISHSKKISQNVMRNKLYSQFVDFQDSFYQPIFELFKREQSQKYVNLIDLIFSCQFKVWTVIQAAWGKVQNIKQEKGKKY